MAAVGTLNEEANKRKERLKTMRQKHADSSSLTDNCESVEKEKLPKPMFRSYKPESEDFKEQHKPVIKPADVQDSIKDQLEAGKTDHVITEVDLTNLAPRKPDWDLKRDISKKLEELERRTQRSIAVLIRERLKASQEEDLATLVNAGTGDAMMQAEVED